MVAKEGNSVRIEEKKLSKIKKILDIVLWIGLLGFAFRKVNQGVDLWDTGYNLANFQWMGTRHMDNMWLFSTYFSNVVGHFFTLLPGGKTLLGMNIYTTFLTVLLIIMASIFLVKYMNIPRILVIIGEFVALNVCWAPSAILYDYLTFIFLDIGLILMLIGLGKDQKRKIFLSGILLGINMFVRFSNLAEVVFCMLIPIFYVVKWIDCKLRKTKVEKIWLKKMLKQMAAFLGGYAISIVVILGYISLRYGFMEYIQGIEELMAMSQTTPGYSPQFMMTFLISSLIKYGLRLWHVVLAAAIGIVCGVIAFRADKRLRKSIFSWIAGVAGILLAVWVVYTYLTKCDYITMDYTSQNSVYAPMLMLGVMTIFIATIRVFSKNADLMEKFFGIIVVSIYLLSVIGSSTEFLLAMNNYFLLMPYLLWELYIFAKTKFNMCYTLSVKTVIVTFAVFCCFMTIGFGVRFVYEEAGSYSERNCKVMGNDTLRGIYTTEYKAIVMQGLSEYLWGNGLTGSEVILYDMNPGLAFYLQLPPAFNSWPALGSYSNEKLESALKEIENRDVLPIMILSNTFETDERSKTKILRKYMQTCGYVKTYSVGTFDVYCANKTISQSSM